MKAYLLIFTILLIQSCGDAGKPYYTKNAEIPESKLEMLINEKSMPEKPKLSEDNFLANYEYPIEVSLYKNNRFYYNLDNLGDGSGTWTYKKGILHLFAAREFFDMNLYIYDDGKDLKFEIGFKDRHGVKNLSLKRIKSKI